MSGEQPSLAERLDCEHANALAALAWCSAAGHVEIGLRLGALLADYWVLRGYISLGLHWLDCLLGRGRGCGSARGPQPAALNACGRLCLAHSDFRRARMRYEQSLALARAGEDGAGIEEALVGLGVALWHLGDYPAARVQLEQAIARCIDHGNRRSLARAYNNLGLVHAIRWPVGCPRRAARISMRLVIARETGNLTVAATTLMNLGNLASNSGDYAAARAYYADALAANRELGNADADRRHTAQSGNAFARPG